MENMQEVEKKREGIFQKKLSEYLQKNFRDAFCYA